MQTAVNTAVSGDTVKTPGPCSASYSSRVSIPSSVAMTVDGGGNTTLTNYGFTINQHATLNTRLTGFIFTNGVPATNDYAVTAHGSPTSAIARIDHNTFDASTVNNTFISIYGNAPLLIDHNTFHVAAGGAPNEYIHNYGSGDISGWNTDVVPGNPNMVFVEDNTFTFDVNSGGSYFGASAMQSYAGSRTIFRHNTLNNMQVDEHGTNGQIWARWWEIYENTFFTANTGPGQDRYVSLRGGTGVVFNNHHTGTNPRTGGGGITMLDDTCGTYPDPQQLGRGINQTNLSPAYIWGNDADMQVGAFGCSSNIQINRDYFLSTTQPTTQTRCQSAADVSAGCLVSYTYVPYTYPHPLQGGASPPPAAPTGLAAAVN